MSSLPPIFVITGQLSAGKSTIAGAVLEQFPFGYHVDVDGIREMVTSGRASPLEWNEETTRQFDLAIEASAALARVYGTAGFAVAIEGGLDPAAIERALAGAGMADRLVGIVLHPRLEVALQRNRERATKPFDTSILEGVMREIDGDISRQPDRPGWHVLDNSDEPIEATVQRVLSIAR
ncbi:MAG TPA: AAA family ATPase [Candidatus Limnocylindrales bacterium]|nr:AAA family ATPase [Candidatus Limnocylindrales bacterium]